MSRKSKLDVGFSLDWLSFTVKGISDTTVARALLFGQDMSSYIEVPHMMGYSYAVRHPFGHFIMSNSKRSDMGVHVMFSGGALNELLQGGIDQFKLIRWAISEGAKVTRIDLAVDLYGTPVDLDKLYKSKQVKGQEGAARTRERRTKDDGGYTIYFGSRKSDKLLRVYNKAADMGMPGVEWTRFEMEFHRDVANEVAAAVSSMSLDEAMTYTMGLIKGQYNADDALYQELLKSSAIHMATTKDASDSTLDWLMGPVAKTLAKQMRLHSHKNVWKLFSESVAANLKAQGGLPPNRQDHDVEAK
jgi:DNA relaxase NicK